LHVSGKFAPKRDIQDALDQENITSTLGFLSATRPAPLDPQTGRVKGKYDEPPLWIFPVADNVNTEHQINILREDIESFHMLDDKTVTYSRKLVIKVLAPYELLESDAPGFLFIISTTNVTIPHLLYREHSVTWPIIRGVTEHLPLRQDPFFTAHLARKIDEPDEPTLSDSSDKALQKDKASSAKNSSLAKRTKHN